MGDNVHNHVKYVKIGQMVLELSQFFTSQGGSHLPSCIFEISEF